jgi:hypothetical protein
VHRGGGIVAHIDLVGALDAVVVDAAARLGADEDAADCGGVVPPRASPEDQAPVEQVELLGVEVDVVGSAGKRSASIVNAMKGSCSRISAVSASHGISSRGKS